MQPKLQYVEASNQCIPSGLQPGLVAIFAGATSGIGASTLRAFVKRARDPRIYLIGRSEAKGRALIQECADLNASAKLKFIKADLSLMKNVEKVCETVQEREEVVNVLMQTVGDPDFEKKDSPEGLHRLMASSAFGRWLMAYDLLPLLRRAADRNEIARVVSVAAAGGEGELYLEDLQARNVPFSALRGHLASLMTMVWEALGARAPGVSFIHTNPGLVRTPYQDRMTGPFGIVGRALLWLASPWQIDIEETGERHLFLLTNGRFGHGGIRVPRSDSWHGRNSAASSIDENPGSLVFSIRADLSPTDGKSMEMTKQYCRQGMAEQVWSLVEKEYQRIGVGPALRKSG